MKQEEVTQQVRTFVGRFVSDPTLDADLDLFSTGLVNSLFAMQLVLFVEKDYNIKVENEDLDYENFKSINAIVAFIGRKTA